ncbi:hypothetical protein NM688_g1245 [Phlebia brevispora]|uniref:Uncharacterized protein n=1 Tax=Phlebia brevispora TaxID=194682 RepID=A0ACC1TC53_9APHY|nr:hypothetical protein NM688_g1245 [Phlebia brevispora]
MASLADFHENAVIRLVLATSTPSNFGLSPDSEALWICGRSTRRLGGVLRRDTPIPPELAAGSRLPKNVLGKPDVLPFGIRLLDAVSTYQAATAARVGKLNIVDQRMISAGVCGCYKALPGEPQGNVHRIAPCPSAPRFAMPSLQASDSQSEIKDIPSTNVEAVIIPEIGQSSPVGDEPPSKDLRFWMVFVACCVSMLLSALEFTAVSTALPTIVHDLSGDDFVWVASAYALASTALLPASGGMAEIFGRRVTMLCLLSFFALGSALCGAAQSMNWLIAARAVQGAGGGGILSMGTIIVADIVPLRERGLYNAVLGLTWALASAIGPLVGGAFASTGKWRWLFYLNLPICGVAAALVFLFLRLRTPSGSFREKITRMDWLGNLLIISSSSACVLALTWGGIRYAWTSARVLTPLLLGLVGIGVFLVYEARWAKKPIVPFMLLSNRTSLSGHIQNFINPILMIAVVCSSPLSSLLVLCLICLVQITCRPTIRRARAHHPLDLALTMLGMSLTIGPIFILTGISIQRTNCYRVQLWMGWAFMMLAMGVMTTLHADVPLAQAVCLPMLFCFGSGMLYPASYFPVLAPLPVTENAHALAFFSFCRSFAQVWGVTIGSVVLQTQLKRRLPASFTSQLPGGVAIAYSAIPVIHALPEPELGEVREAFASSLAVIWQVMIGIGGIGCLASLAMKGLPLHTNVDEKWGMEEKQDPKLEDPVKV